MTDNYAELVARLQDLAPCVDDITGPSSAVEIAAAKALREAGDAIEALVTERAQGIVALCVCNNAASPQPDCPCVTCTVKRANDEREQLRAELARVREALTAAGWACEHEYIEEARGIIDAALAAGKGEGEKP